MKGYSYPKRLPPIPEGKGAKFHKSWFESIVARIENIKPLGAGQPDYSTKATGPIECRIKPEDGVEIFFNAKTYQLNVCSGGTPATIAVYGPPISS